MNKEDLLSRSKATIYELCVNIRERCVGSEGNRQATGFFKTTLESIGWTAFTQEFNAVDWNDGGAVLKAGGIDFPVLASPYSAGYSGSAELAAVSSVQELREGHFAGKILLLHGEIAREQLMPKNFVFYNPEEHQQIISLLEKSQVQALICATGRNAALAGGVYPFPLIEDGDFDIPSVYMTDEEGERLLPFAGEAVNLRSVSERVPGRGCNVIGRKGEGGSGRIVVTAHIDAKKGTPGAIDNATGVAVLLLAAQLLNDYRGDHLVELVALNGEDYYAVPGQMKYIADNQDQFGDMVLNINIDGAAYKNSRSAFSYYNLPDHIMEKVSGIVDSHPDLVEGVPWVQGDHSIFVQYGVPAIAISSQWFTENIDSQDVTHTSKDNPGIVDYPAMVEIAVAIDALIRGIQQGSMR